MLNGNPVALKRLQVGINDTIRSLFRMPLRTANKCLKGEFRIVPVDIEH